jgi:hypothetical protein
MPRRNSLTRRLLHHLLLISLARGILTVLGRGRAWDEWDDRGEVEPATNRSFRFRFAQTLSFSMLFFAGLALSAGAGNGVRSMLADDESTPVAVQSATGATGPTGPAGPTEPAAPAESAAPSSGQVDAGDDSASTAAPVDSSAPAPTEGAPAPTAPRVAVLNSRPTHASSGSNGPAAAPKRAAISTTHVARPTATRARPQVTRKHKQKQKAPATKHKAPALDPEVDHAAGATVWLNSDAPDPTPPAARLQLRFARELVAFSRQAHVDWALVLATLRADGHNGRTPATRVALRGLAFRLGSLGGRANRWAAALSYSRNTATADRVVALSNYYRAVGLASLVRGLLSQKADLQDRVLHDARLHIYSGGRADIAAGRVDVRVLALMLYLAQTYREVTVSCLVSGHRLYARPGHISAHVYGRAIDIAALHNISITGHQQPGGITEQAVRSILMLPGGMLPAQVISLMGLGGPSFPLANHYDHIHVGY